MTKQPQFNFDFHGSALDNIFADYKTMQDECPVSWSENYGGFWTLTSFEQIREAEHDQDTYSVAPSMILPSFGTDRPLIPLDIDPPRQVGYRRILLPFFTAKKMDALLPRTHEIAEELLDDVAGQEVFDASVYCRMLPALVFGEYCGFPAEHAAQFDQWVDDIVFARTEDESIARASANAVYDYFRDLIAKRRTDPGPDLISALLQADHNGKSLDDEEMLDICYLLFVAGLETSAGTIRAAIWYLAQHPEELSKLAADPSLIPAATEEVLRALSPVQAMARTLKTDTEVDGIQMKAGERVVLAFGAANRDPDVFECPHEMQLDRPTNPHMSFGMGAHRCLGSNLARREVNVALEVFVKRFPRFELAEETVWHGTHDLHIRPMVDQ